MPMAGLPQDQHVGEGFGPSKQQPVLEQTQTY